jgi:dipeptidase E
MRQLLLVSNSTLHGSGYLDHCENAIREFLSPRVERVVFVPFAQHDRDGYAAKVRERFERMGLALESVHAASSKRAMHALVEGAQAVFVGGGNTFRLLNALYEHELLEPIRSRVREGMPYVGSSAGSNVACVTIKTTNDMPIVYPPSFDALALVPFNINPHYLDPIPGSTHMGETRETRIREFHEMNDPPVVGLREGAWLHVVDDSVTLRGSTGARVFGRGLTPKEFQPGARLNFLLDAR